MPAVPRSSIPTRSVSPRCRALGECIAAGRIRQGWRLRPATALCVSSRICRAARCRQLPWKCGERRVGRGIEVPTRWRGATENILGTATRATWRGAACRSVSSGVMDFTSRNGLHWSRTANARRARPGDRIHALRFASTSCGISRNGRARTPRGRCASRQGRSSDGPRNVPPGAGTRAQGVRSLANGFRKIRRCAEEPTEVIARAKKSGGFFGRRVLRNTWPVLRTALGNLNILRSSERMERAYRAPRQCRS